ncbi:Transketolase 2 [uncultured Roseburia sp.]|uniref:Transketolase n=1 Tax=Brotonthovivens ammoniilytica TaxID=2981725 RepID=A0ABT2TFY3_9FIRM|nr:transketolase [Brotonthovivens ammoniilytica]MCU6761089.1 transketolase [Brotonthovivens ammoniilytica]SCI18501.1 Transketolase 2 [uncultured Roseburia sp.]
MTELETLAVKIRIAEMKCFKQRGFGHVGGSLSIADALAALYGKLMKYDPQRPDWADRDYLVMSKGHCGPGLYAALAVEGFFPEEWLLTLNEPHTRLPSHCDKNLTPGIDMTTGSLGQGASTSAGMALGLKLDGRKNTVYCILGDGECDEGQVWEMLLFAAAKKLDNYVVFVDYNRKQLDGSTDDILSLGDLREKFEVFGWYAVDVNGNNPDEIADAVLKAKEEHKDRPIAVILNTKKGYGVDFIEAMEFNHHITLNHEQADAAIAQLEGRL